MKVNPPIVRMAPSPTGNLHIGTARTALFNFLFTKQNKGRFILRIEDTDKERSKKEYEENIVTGLSWLGITWDDFYRQSEREDLYKSYVEKLIKNGRAYISKERETENAKRGEVIRFRNTNQQIVFNDIIRGDVKFDTTELGDFVIAKSITEPLYHLAAVVDDHETGVTHVIRGEDHLSNTPRQILIQEAIGAQRPLYAHLPLILAKDRSKMSKRKHGERVAIDYYKKEGFLSEALVNYLTMLGWNPKSEREIFSLPELIKVFQLENIQKGGAIFDEEKLRWLNREYMKLVPKTEFLSKMTEYFQNSKRLESHKWKIEKKLMQDLLPVVLDRIDTWGNLRDEIDSGIYDYFFEAPAPPKEMLLWKEEKDFENTKRHIKKSMQMLSEISQDKWSKEKIKDTLWDYASKEGRGAVLWPLRVALSGLEKSPDPFTISEILGNIETLNRIRHALDTISDEKDN